MENKKEKLRYKIAKDLYNKAKDAVDTENKDALPHPSEWLNDRNRMICVWKEYLQLSNYTQDDSFSIYMNFMYKNY